MTQPAASDQFRAIRTCDQVLESLDAYPHRDDAIALLQFAIAADRLHALGMAATLTDARAQLVGAGA